MSFGGSEEPTAYGELISIGGIGPESNKQLSAALAEILQTKLSIPPSRFYIKFYDVKVCLTDLAAEVLSFVLVICKQPSASHS